MKNPQFRHNVQEVTDDTFNYEKLLIHRIDGFLADPLSYASVVRKRGLTGKIEKHPIDIYFTDIFIMFSKKSVLPATVQAFNNSLSQIRNSGEYHQIIEKYAVQH